MTDWVVSADCSLRGVINYCRCVFARKMRRRQTISTPARAACFCLISHKTLSLSVAAESKPRTDMLRDSGQIYETSLWQSKDLPAMATGCVLGCCNGNRYRDYRKMCCKSVHKNTHVWILSILLGSKRSKPIWNEKAHRLVVLCGTRTATPSDDG